ncbi:hypothetical protein GXN76_13215 [Kroppenstedtia pulmonis]|uniref:Peptidoglycan recognition protein family domain-containing protein n=1 Tax=Kroppenstedtia pulmonis TaxID=1380685 RepID=A0A7D3XK87_9BACL|nr:N-acetylmuramoyl-L-alanine amidase [Kroppenstedtia pulmonis]QKG85339.1 hypothetical protein GXN76_13215 [Kroppenstedtia pulmonis]
MTTRLTRIGFLLVLGFLLFFSLLSLPVIPASWAETAAIKVQADEVRHQTLSDFSKGQTHNLELEKEGAHVTLSMEDEKKKGEFISPVITSDIVFTDVGLRWIQGEQTVEGAKPEDFLQFYLRTSLDNQNWSSWHALHADPQEGPDNERTNELFSNLVYAEKGKYAQYKAVFQPGTDADAALQDVKLTFINSEDGQKIPAKGKVSLGSFVAQKANAAIKRPNIVSRGDWGADESLRYLPDGKEDFPREYASKVTHLAVHHTDTVNDDPNPAARMRSIYYYHAKTRGWGDIGYNAIIGSDGLIYEGRKGRDGEVLTPGVVAAHAFSFNNGSFGVSMMGNFSQKKPPAKMRQALVDLLAYQADIHQINPQGKADFVRNCEYNNPSVPKVDPNIPTLQGHKDFPRSSTACPGTYLHQDLGNIRSDVAKKLAEEKDTIILDNADPTHEFVGDWKSSTNQSGYYGKDYQAIADGWGFSTFTWKFNLPTDGDYKVWVHYTSGPDRATNAPYTLHTNQGEVTKTVNQKQDGSTWVELGTFSFNKGANQIVQSNDADGYVIADAIQLKKVQPTPPPQPKQAIIDNSDTAHTSSKGVWTKSTNVSGYYGSNYQANSKGTGADQFTWSYQPPETGVYRVSVRYTSASDRASNAPYTVTYSDGKTTRTVNQRTNGGKWVELGTYNLQKDVTSKVTLTDNANGFVIADAVRYEYLPGWVISDNGHTTNQAVGAWKSSTAIKTLYGTNYVYRHKGTGSDTFTWNLKVPKSGTYKVYAHYLAYTDRATNAPYTIHHQNGKTVKTVNQQINGGKWVSLGNYNFDQTTGGKVVLSNKADGIVVADAIRLEPVPVTVISDNRDPGNEAVGVWKASSKKAGFEGTDYQYDYKGDGSHTFTWYPKIPEAGSYKVYVKYLTHTDRATNAPYTVHHQNGAETIRINQQTNNATWVYLGTFPFAPGTDGKVVLSNSANGIVVADSVRLVKE